jgi:phosphatidyl-myo-inositol alpha-mannosyltransferase
MKVAFVLDDGLDKPDGVQQCVLTLGSWLSRKGHDVHYIVGATKRTDIPNLHVAARNLPVKFNGNRLTIPLPTAKRRIQKLLDSINPEVLHVQVPYSPFMGAKAVICAKPTTGIVGTFHVLPYGRLARDGTWLLGLLLRRSLKRFDAMYAGAPASAEFASWSMRQAVAVLPHAIDVGRFRAAQLTERPTGKLRIVFLGRLVPRKGALQLVKAVAALPEAVMQQIEVRIGGRGPLLPQLEAYVAAHDMSAIVGFDGFVSEDDKPAYLARADIAIFPSISGESFGISIIEPLAAGAGVVVGGDNPGYASILGEWPETLVKPLDVHGFSAQLAMLVTDGALRQQLHEAQQAAVPHYDIETVGKQWLAIYAAAVAGHRR